MLDERNTSFSPVLIALAITVLVILCIYSVWTELYWLTAFMAGVLFTGLFFARILYKLAKHLYTGVIESSKGTLEFSVPHSTNVVQETVKRQAMDSHGPSLEHAEKIRSLEIMLKERDLLNAHLKEINTQLETLVSERTAALERSHAARRNLMANISHDLRTPITLIQGYTETLLDGIISDPEQQQKYLNLIHTRVLKLNRLIQELFELNKLESGQPSLQLQMVSAAGLVKSIYDKCESDILNANLSLRLILPNPEASPIPGTDTIYIDPDRIERVFLNLLTNSIRYSLPGGKIVLCALKPQVKEVFDMAGFSQLFRIFDTQEEAIKEL